MKHKLLIVDDEAICTLFLSSCLEEEGYDVQSAIEGSEALRIGYEFNPDVLITDWMLKEGKDGVEVAEELYARNSNLKIIFITGMASDVIRERAQSMPYAAVLEKPIDLDEMLGVLKDILAPAG